MSFPEPRAWTPEEVEPFHTAFLPGVMHHIADGDTFDLCLDLGHDRGGEIVRVRLVGEDWLKSGRRIGVNTWEERGVEREKGLAATARVEELIPEGVETLSRSWLGGSRGSYYRWLHLLVFPGSQDQAGRYYRDETSSTHYCLGDVLLFEGHAREWWRGWKRGKPRPE